jgi:hypothetical protein
MCRQWEIAKHCHTALSILLLNIQRQESSGSKRLQSDNEHSTQSERRKKQKTTLAGYDEDHTTYNSLVNGNRKVISLQDAQNLTAAHSNEVSSSIFDTTIDSLSEPTTTRIYQESGADDTNTSPSEVSILAMPNSINNETIEVLQWPDESSFLTTNFDLNMTDLFQNSSWDPMLLDAFNNQGGT